jgi:hypothetical protein
LALLAAPKRKAYQSTVVRQRLHRAVAATITAALLTLRPHGPALAGERHDRSALLDAAAATITVNELREHVGLLADDTLEGREAGSRGGRAAARYLEGKLQSSGLRPAGDSGGYLQRFDSGYQNLLAILPGTDPTLKDEYVLVGAHYDHVGYGSRRNSNGPIGYIHNGADDNASGVAALLELIDALSRTHWQPRRSILFAFWDGEEINLLGSRHWVRQPTVPLQSVRLAVNVDMVGRLRNGRLEVGGTRTAAGLRQMLSSERLPPATWLDFSWEYKENSDHWPFFVAGVPSLILHTGLHSEYHTPRDDVERLNVPGVQTASAYLLEAVCRAADADVLPTFRPASRSENPFVQRTRQAPLSPPPPRLGLTWKWMAEVESPVLRVDSISSGSAAAKAGLLPGDEIVAVDGRPVDHEFLLAAAVLRADSEVTLQVVRGGADLVDVVVQLDGEPTQLGLSWREDDAEPGAVFVTRVIPYSPAARAGLKLYDRIYAVAGAPFESADAFLKRVLALLAEEPSTLQLEIERAGHIQTVDIDLRLPGAGESDASL